MKIEIISIVIGLIFGLVYGFFWRWKVCQTGRALRWDDWLPFVTGAFFVYGLTFLFLSIIS